MRLSAWRRRGRVLVGGAACVVLAAGLLVLSGTLRLGKEEGVAKAADELPWGCAPPPQPGYPRGWEAGIQVSTYGTANAVNRNLLTVIPIVDWSGVGPDMSMVLYHNSATVGSTLPLTDSMGFSLGQGWRMSYSDQIIPVVGQAGQRLVVRDDGTQDVYVDNGGVWEAPPGVFDRLESVDTCAYKLTHKDGSFKEFNCYGHLTSVVDAVGNELTITRQTVFIDQMLIRRIKSIADASGRTLSFEFSDEIGGGDPNRLMSIIDVNTGFGTRAWFFDYDGMNRLDKASFPITKLIRSEIVLGYQSPTQARITSMTDKRQSFSAEAARTYTFAYAGNALQSVTDPTPAQGSALIQSFATTCSGGWTMPVVNTTYTDRRGEGWVYQSIRENPQTSPDNGPIAFVENPLGQRQEFLFTSRLLMQYRDALGRGWDYAYDGRGNRLSAIDPQNTDREHQWEYDWDDATQTGVDVMTKYIDPQGHETQYLYENSTYPTLLTKIIEPPDGQGSGPAETVVEYYLTEPEKRGQIKRVVDAEGVCTTMDYDEWGQLASYAEGRCDEQTSICNYKETYQADKRSRVNRSGWGAQGCFAGSSGVGESTHNLADQATGGTCPPAESPPPIMGDPPALLAAFPIMPSGAPNVPVLEGSWNAQYSGFGRLNSMTMNLTMGTETPNRTQSYVYDELGRVDTDSINSNEYGPQLTRGFTYSYNLAQGIITQSGPDDLDTVISLDEANRVVFVRRGPSGASLLQASYMHYANGLPHIVYFGNGASVEYTFDVSNRLAQIHHKDPAGGTLLRMDYAHYDHRDLPLRVTETSPGGSRWSEYSYDTRGRLIREVKAEGEYPNGITEHDIRYAYDQNGNRLEKKDIATNRRVAYMYDLSDPDPETGFGSRANRLMFYETFDIGVQPEERLSTTWYYYDFGSGNVTRVVTNEDGSETYTATRFGYAKNGRTVTHVLGESWTWDGEATSTSGYTVLYARHFRYDSGRARYLNRAYNPAAVQNGQFTDYTNVWTDYAGDAAYGDFTISGGQAVNTAAWEPGIGQVTGLAGSPVTRYHHGDHLGTLRLMSGDAGAGDGHRVWTAFGERLAGPTEPDRYGYVGAHGYQAHGEFPFLHVGARYYDPASGRFLQRDPEGIGGGLNSYLYAIASPTVLIDPQGEAPAATDVGRFWGYLVRGRLKDAEAILDSLAQLEGQTETVRRMQKALKAAQCGSKWLKKVKKKSLKDKKKEKKSLEEALEDHKKKYNDHPDSEEIGTLEWKVRVMEDLVKGKGSAG